MKSMVPITFNAIIRRLDKRRLPSFDMVVGVGKGGVVPAALVAAKLGCDLRTIRFEYRDKDNKPLYSKPLRKSLLQLPRKIKRILLVDDVAVTGKTLREAKSSLKGRSVTTMVFKGEADYVLFPEISDCVLWPWKI